MILNREKLIGGVLLFVLVGIALYATWFYTGPDAKYRDLTTSVDRGLDDATEQYFRQRIALAEASIAAAKQKGEDVDLDLYLSVASDAYSIGDLLKARENIEIQLKENPAHYTGWNFYGTLLEEMGDYDGARDAYIQAIDLGGAASEEFYRDYVTLLKTHFPQDREQIRAILEISVQQRGQTSWSMVELGRWYAEAGQCEEAINHYEVAVSLAPDIAAIKDELAEVRNTCK